MSVQTKSKHYLDGGRLWFKLTRMKVRKTEFLVEVILSIFVLVLAYHLGGSGEIYAGIIGLIHSFNIARAIEAYRETQTHQDYQSKFE